MSKKEKERAVKIYKPEVLTCPKCNNKLYYKYTVSNKDVVFSSGKIFRIKNLGYGCSKCADNFTYISQTANKLAFKGITYSTKVLLLISTLKENKIGRESICDYLALSDIDISDRNVDFLYKKYLDALNMDYDYNINQAYKKMLDEFKNIRISVDQIIIDNNLFVLFYDGYFGKLLGMWRFNKDDYDALYHKLSLYVDKDKKISYIYSTRNVRGSRVYQILKELSSSNVKFVSYLKFK